MGWPTRVVIGAMVLGGLAAMAQELPQEIRWLALQDFRGEAELRYESRSNERVTKLTGDTTRVDDSFFHEAFEFSWKGYVYHPRFLQFSPTLGFDLEQGKLSLDSPSGSLVDSHSVSSPRYLISGIFLPEHPVSVTFAFSRFLSTVTPAFAERVDVTTTAENIAVHFKDIFIPTRLYYSHTSSIQDQRGFGESVNTDQTVAGVSMAYSGDDTDAQLSYEYTDETEDRTVVGAIGGEGSIGSASSLLSTFSSIRKVHDLSLNSQFRFGAMKQSSLSSLLSYRDETGTFPSQRLIATENLSLRHTSSLRGNYGATYSQTVVGGVTATSTQEHAALSHQLFQSLFTDVELHASQDTADAFTSDRQGGSATVSYRKHIPYGILSLGLGAGREVTDEGGATGVSTVLDERHVLSSTTTVLLGETGIDTTTIVVTGAAHIPTYIVDVDYLLIVRGSRIELRRLSTGTIPDGAAVLVSYSFTVETPLKHATRTLRRRFRLDLFDHLALYGSKDTTNQDLISGVDDGRLEDVDDTIVGTQVTWGPAVLVLEREVYDSSLSAYTADEARLDITQELGQSHLVRVSALTRRVSFQNQQALQSEQTIRRIQGSYRFFPRYLPRLDVSAGYEENDSLDFQSKLTFFHFTASYRLRATTFSAEFGLDRDDDTSALETNKFFMFSVRRTF